DVLERLLRLKRSSLRIAGSFFPDIEAAVGRAPDVLHGQARTRDGAAVDVDDAALDRRVRDELYDIRLRPDLFFQLLAQIFPQFGSEPAGRFEDDGGGGSKSKTVGRGGNHSIIPRSAVFGVAIEVLPAAAEAEFSFGVSRCDRR